MKQVILLCCLLSIIGAVVYAGENDYTEEKLFDSRPRLDHEMDVGHIGPTGIKGRVNRGGVLKVEGAEKETPAEGKFNKGDVIAGVNSKALKGRNPFVVLGNAITEAEGTDGLLVFDVESDGKPKQVSLSIPVLGAYSKTWPVNCPKSKKIIEQAAAFYSDKTKFKQGGVAGGLMCLFLLSTGEDKYLPRVREYFDGAIGNPSGIGDHTWDNGYNGIAVCEYYLRTGDKDVLPVIQAYCDNARDRQKFGCGWTHWGKGINPGYCGAGIMNPASSQILTTLLLAKECGVNVDEKTLLGSLKFFYRFAGHGTVPYGDDRSEGGLGSNGKDSMIAAAMQAASGAKGDTTIYQMARDYLSMSTISNYPNLIRGHADEGRGDGIWRGIASSYLQEMQAKDWRATQDRLTWWYDLSRYANGGLGMATCQRFNDIGSGIGVALGYTAHLKSLRITGAPRSKHAKEFTLPASLWGTKADLAFLKIEHSPNYFNYGRDEPTHIPFYLFGSAYSKPGKEAKDVPLKEILKNVHHRRYMIRCQAAKALRIAGHSGELEKLLSDKDPRVRRAALDGIIDYRYWFSMGRDPLKSEQYTPGMIAAILKMLNDSKEAWYVVDGALFAIKNMPANVIQENLDAILPWTKHQEWWLRESSFTALSGLDKDETLYVKILPTLMEMVIDEYHTHPRGNMLAHLRGKVNKDNLNTPSGKMIMAGLIKAAKVSEVKSGLRSGEGAFNICTAVELCLEKYPSTAVLMAKTIEERFAVLEAGQIISLVGAPNSNRENEPFGLYTLLDKQNDAGRQALTDILYDVYRPELIKRMKASDKENPALLDTIIDLTKLKSKIAGWRPIGTPDPTERVWRYTSFDPQNEKDKKHPRERKRFRDIAPPANLKGWFEPTYDDSKWRKGKAPIGKGEFKRDGAEFSNHSKWGAGEFLAMRTTFDMDALDYDSYRISVLANQGFHIYLNGKRIHSYGWWKDKPHYRLVLLGKNEIRHLKKGKNVLAIYANTDYPSAMNKRSTVRERAQIDCCIEGLRKKDLGL
jgi:hypothetical protein